MWPGRRTPESPLDIGAAATPPRTHIEQVEVSTVKVPFTWKVTGWFVIGWSAEFPVGEVRPLRHFGEYLVAYRDESGELRVLSGHCRHLGAHIGHGGKVVGNCVECPVSRLAMGS